MLVFLLSECGWLSRVGWVVGDAAEGRAQDPIVQQVAALVFLATGLLAGRALRPAPPPLIIVRRADSPLSDSEGPGNTPTRGSATANSQQIVAAEVVYICGARTKKGTPCSRRVHGPVRCWQHKGLPAMLPPEKLIVKE